MKIALICKRKIQLLENIFKHIAFIMNTITHDS